MSSVPRLAWYGDDFTGATDTLAEISQAGLRAMLFLGVPTKEARVAAARALGGPLEAVGIAGATRSMAPAALRDELEPAGAFFAALGSPVLHYKVCSTFDSSTNVGSIAAAVQVLRRHVRNRLVPIVGGQPSLGRYCAFSNLFAAAGRGGVVERLDRHPTMRNHPVTPMQEADLRRHLELQGLAPIAALHYPAYELPPDAQSGALLAIAASNPAAVLFDVSSAAQLPAVGRLLWQQALRERLLAVGPSSVAQALIAHWRADGESGAGPVPPAVLARAEGPVLVFAGSLSPVTARQVRCARSFERIALGPEALTPAAAARIAGVLGAGRNVLAFTAPQDDAPPSQPTGEVARRCAQFLRDIVLDQARGSRPLRRIGIAGGDTSSLAVQALGLWGLSYRGQLGAGVTVSRTHSDVPAVDGLELMLKGGQMGGEDVFEQLLGT